MPITDQDKLTGHEYDGIVEYDNPTPAWWHVIFLLTVVFSFFYYVFWEFSPLAPSIEDRWQARQVAEYKKLFGAIGDLKSDEATISSMRGNAQMLAIAKGMFESNCAACHGKDGGGTAGVNLTDDSYKNVKALADLYTVITKGARNGAMPAWENRLGQNERVILAAYVANLRGTKPAAPKGPEGDPIPAWPEIPAAAPAPAPAK